ncbi:hypothetical protein ANO14919_134780 [Xylariales sp. No.14919]|nr:hypothetical protein ANO14919_134780 [Xylariales sp. No.14919]
MAQVTLQDLRSAIRHRTWASYVGRRGFEDEFAQRPGHLDGCGEVLYIPLFDAETLQLPPTLSDDQLRAHALAQGVSAAACDVRLVLLGIRHPVQHALL